MGKYSEIMQMKSFFSFSSKKKLLDIFGKMEATIIIFDFEGWMCEKIIALFLYSLFVYFDKALYKPTAIDTNQIFRTDSHFSISTLKCNRFSHF